MTKTTAVIVLALAAGSAWSNSQNRPVSASFYLTAGSEYVIRHASMLPFQHARRLGVSSIADSSFSHRTLTLEEVVHAKNSMFRNWMTPISKVNPTLPKRWLNFKQRESLRPAVGKRAASKAMLESAIIGTWEMTYGPEELAHEQCFLGDEEDSWEDFLAEADSNDNGVLDEEDFEALRESGDEDLPPSWDDALQEIGDANGDGVIDREEFEAKLASEIDEWSAACSSCGYYTSQSDAQGEFDCITCSEGYEIDVAFDDCTGYCVPIGTADIPISESGCRPPGEFVNVVHFREDGQVIINGFESGELLYSSQFTYSLEGNRIRLSDGWSYQFVDDQLSSVMTLDDEFELEFELSNDILTIDEEDVHIRSDRRIVEPPDLTPVTRTDTLIGPWKVVSPWADESEGYAELVEFRADGTMVRLQTWFGDEGDEGMFVQTARYEFDNGLIREFDREWFYFDQDYQSWVSDPVYPEELLSKVFEIDGKILLLPEEMWDPATLMVTWSDEVVLPEGIDEAIGITDLPPTAVDDYTRLTDFDEIGGKLVFSTCMGLGGNCAMVSIDADKRDQVVLPNGIQPAWSSDGSKIAFVADGLFVSDADGANKMRVSEFGAEYPAWSPAGNLIAFQRLNLEAMEGLMEAMMQEGSEEYLMPVFPYDIIVLDLLNNTEKVIAQGQWPVWSPDGRKILYTHTGPEGYAGSHIETIELGSGAVDALALGFQAIWSPNGMHIAFARVDSSRPEDIDESLEEDFGPGSGMPLSIFVKAIGSDDAEMVVASKQPIFSLFFFGGIRVLHGWSANSEKFLYTEWQDMSAGPSLALYDVSERETVTVAAGIGMVNPSWHDTELSTAIGELIGATLPVSYHLSQNYPNPFNSRTVIRFSLPKKRRVEITIYDLIGQRIANVADQVYGPGQHQLTWDGAGLVSGCYFYVLRTGDTKLVRKMMVLR